MQSFALLSFVFVAGLVALLWTLPAAENQGASAQYSNSTSYNAPNNQTPVLTNPILSLNAKCCDGTGTDFSANMLQDSQVHWSITWSASVECGEFNVVSTSPPHAFWYHPTPQLCKTDTHTGTVSLIASYFSSITNSYGASVLNEDRYTCTDSIGSPSDVVSGDSCTFQRTFWMKPTFVLGGDSILSTETLPKPINANPPSSQSSPSSSSTSSVANGVAQIAFPLIPSVSKDQSAVEWQTDRQYATSPITGESYPTTSVTGFNFNSTTHSMLFNITGTSSNQGFINILVPGQLLSGPFKATFDGNSIPISTTAQGNDTIIQTTLHYSTHVLNVTGTSSPALDNAVIVIPGENSTSSTTIGNPSSSGPTPTPEFPFPATIGLMMAAVFSIVIFISRKRMFSNLKDTL